MDMAKASNHSPYYLGLRDLSYVAHLSSSLNQLRQHGSLCDVTIIVGDQTFPAHKAVLSCASQYFESMFTSGFQESISSEVTVPGAPESFAQLIQFAYTGSINLSTTNVAGILNMACYMQFPHAVEACAGFLSDNKTQISMDDCFEIWSIAENFGSSLLEISMTYGGYLVQNFTRLLKSQIFLEHATVEFILKCLENEEIETDESTELKILQVVINWLKFNWDGRKLHTVILLNKIRLGLVSQEKLKDFLEELDIVGMEECKMVMKEVVQLQSTTNGCSKEHLTKRYPEWFVTRNTITTFLKIGGKPHGSLYFDERGCTAGCWKKLERMATLPYPSHGSLNDFSLVAVDETLYAGGGESKYSSIARGRPLVYRCTTQCMNNFYMYNSSDNKWIELPPMTTKRKSFTMIGYNNYIYAIGGVDVEGKHLVDVERYNMAEQKWEEVTSLCCPVSSASVVSFGGCLIICGLNMWSHDDDIEIAIQIYRPNQNSWYLVHKFYVCPGDNMEPYSALLTVQNDSLYFVYFQDKLGERFARIPRVHKVQCNFAAELPTVTLLEVKQDQSMPETSIKAFSIDGKVFITKYKYVQQVDVQKADEDNKYDLSKWQNIAFSGQGSVVPFTFDKQRLIIRI